MNEDGARNGKKFDAAKALALANQDHADSDNKRNILEKRAS